MTAYLPDYSLLHRWQGTPACDSDFNIITSGHLKMLILSDLEKQKINISLHYEIKSKNMKFR